MRAVVQRVLRASVRASGETVASIGAGLLALVGVRAGDGPPAARYVGEKIANLRVFRDDEGLMNRSLADIGGEALVVSQFTLYGDVRRGRRPSFVEAARGEAAEPLVRAVADELRACGIRVCEGVFGATMEIELVNDGPVTIIMDSP